MGEVGTVEAVHLQHRKEVVDVRMDYGTGYCRKSEYQNNENYCKDNKIILKS